MVVIWLLVCTHLVDSCHKFKKPTVPPEQALKCCLPSHLQDVWHCPWESSFEEVERQIPQSLKIIFSSLGDTSESGIGHEFMGSFLGCSLDLKHAPLDVRIPSGSA